jgi:hypothetical protein
MAKRKMRKKIGEDEYVEKEDAVNLNLNRRSCPTKMLLLRVAMRESARKVDMKG